MTECLSQMPSGELCRRQDLTASGLCPLHDPSRLPSLPSNAPSNYVPYKRGYNEELNLTIEDYREARTSPELLDHTHEILILDAEIRRVSASLNTPIRDEEGNLIASGNPQELTRAWSRFTALVDRIPASISAPLRPTLRLIESLITRTSSQDSLRRQLLSLVEQRKKMTDAIIDQTMKTRMMVDVSNIEKFTLIVVTAIKDEVRDIDTRRRLVSRITQAHHSAGLSQVQQKFIPEDDRSIEVITLPSPDEVDTDPRFQTTYVSTPPVPTTFPPSSLSSSSALSAQVNTGVNTGVEKDDDA